MQQSKELEELKKDILKEWSVSSGITTTDFIEHAVENAFAAGEKKGRNEAVDYLIRNGRWMEESRRLVLEDAEIESARTTQEGI